jgi:hypothetical protein
VLQRVVSAFKRRLGVGKPRPGSGLPARPVIRTLVWLRRASQVGFLGLFLYLLVETALSRASCSPTRSWRR